MFTFIVIIHVLACIFLIIVILMQSGRGGGLSEAFGGGGTIQSLFGTKSTTILTKITITLAIIFLVTSLLLTIVGRMKGVSLMERISVEEETKEKVPAKEEEEPLGLPLKPKGMPLP